MKIRKSIFAILCFLLSSIVIFAQNVTITGTVRDESDMPLPGVGVVVKGTTRGVVTGEDGRFSLQVSQNEILVFSCLGYINQEQRVTKSSTINVMLEPDNIVLDEAVAVGYGTMKSSHVSSAITKIEAEDISDRPAVRIDQALQGKVAGVFISESTGEPGMALTVKIRGTNSINHDSGPLYVVDGFPISGDLRGFNPADIESIEVLKDASSAAIYGSRGSGGVILITTKQGKKGRPVVSYDGSVGFQKRFSKVDVLNRDEYIEYALEERYNSYVYSGGDLSVPEHMRDAHKYAIDPIWRTDPTSLPDNDWQEIISRTALRHNHTLSVQGGTEHARYFASINYLDQDGIILKTDYSRIAFQGNIEARAKDWLSFGANIHASYSDRNKPGEGIVSPTSRSILLAPTLGLFEQVDGNMNHYYAPFHLNPYYFTQEIKNEDVRSDFLGTAYIKFMPIKGLEIKSSVGYNVINYHTYYFISQLVNRGNPSSGTWGSNIRHNLLNENTVSYTRDFGKFHMNILGGFTYQSDYYEAINFSMKGFADTSIKTANAATSFNSGSGSATRSTLMSFIGRANLAYDDKYLLTLSLRYDGCSRFGKNHKWGLFPAVSMGWNIYKEDFFEPLKPAFSNMKLRFSFGGVGNNAIGDYASIGLVSKCTGVYNNVASAGYVPGNFSNDDLTWEKTYTTDIGIDLGFVNNRINLSVDGYIANTVDMLLDVPVPELTGFSNATQNIGKVRNAGIEVELETKNVMVGKFGWTTTFNFAYNKNKVIQLGPDNAPIIVYNSDFPIQKIEVGYPIRYFYLFQQDGLFKNEEDCIINKNMAYANKNPQPGDMKYKDIDGDGKLTENDKTYCGKTTPDINYGITNTFTFGGLELSIFMDGVSDCKLINMGKKETTQSRSNVRGYWRNRWRSEENPGNGLVPRACATDDLTTPSSWWLEDGKFWRIRNINLSYSLPSKLFANNRFISGCKFHALVDNVCMIDKYNHLSQVQNGIDYDEGYPLARTFEFGVNLKF